jgi:hypothetical protein
MSEVDELRQEVRILRQQIAMLTGGFPDVPRPERLPLASVPLPMLCPGQLLCGIYFLCQGGEVVYVGQSITVAARVSSHASEGIKQFDSAWFVPCEEWRLGCVEAHWIEVLRPRYNMDGIEALRRKAVEREQKRVNKRHAMSGRYA